MQGELLTQLKESYAKPKPPLALGQGQMIDIARRSANRGTFSGTEELIMLPVDDQPEVAVSVEILTDKESAKITIGDVIIGASVIKYEHPTRGFQEKYEFDLGNGWTFVYGNGYWYKGGAIETILESDPRRKEILRKVQPWGYVIDRISSKGQNVGLEDQRIWEEITPVFKYSGQEGEELLIPLLGQPVEHNEYISGADVLG